MIQYQNKYNLIFKTSKFFIIFTGILSGVFSYFENFLPRFLILSKIGFGNIPLLMVINIASPLELFLIYIIKVFINLFFSGTLFSIIAFMSIAGNLGAFLAILIIKKLKISLITKSIVIAYFSNVFQLILYSLIIIKDLSTISLSIILFFISLITGGITGYLANSILVNKINIILKYR